ncbi:MAG: hypothetical protein QXN16_02940 [Candidatus Micrarchaeaceae archaeon]
MTATYPCPFAIFGCKAEFATFEEAEAHAEREHKQILDNMVDYVKNALYEAALNAPNSSEISKTLYNSQICVRIPYALISPSELMLLKEPICDADMEAVIAPYKGNEVIILAILSAANWKKEPFSLVMP